MDDIFDGWNALPASAQWDEWKAQFVFMLMMGYGSELSVGEQQVAAHMAPDLYREGLNTKDACRRAISEAQSAPASATLEAANVFRNYAEQAAKDYPEVFGTKEDRP